MRNRPVRRWAAALLNLLFLLAWGEPVSLHPCPTHDGVAVAAMAGHAAVHGGSAMAHGHHAPAGSHGTHALPAHGTPTTDQGAHACQCLGACSVGTAVALPSAVAVEWQGTIRHAAEPPLVEPATPSAAAPRLLPFANGPPSVA